MMDWNAISQEYELSEAFIGEHKHNIDWKQLRHLRPHPRDFSRELGRVFLF